MAIGDIGGVLIGQVFESRMELHEAGVHRATQAGITGRAETGAESIVLSGGYVDDEDHGDYVIYTGHGGRDAVTGRQVQDQDFTRQNKALVTSCLMGLPVRVVRGSKHRSPHSPGRGYRYDGLYWVDTYWKEQGQDGFVICRFRLVSSEGVRGDAPRVATTVSSSAPRVESTVLRVVRDTVLSKKVKEMHDYRCQVCGVRIEGLNGPYAEAAHIRPLGAPHDGPDVIENILCLCPNHHVAFDYGGFYVDDDMNIVGGHGKLHTVKAHRVGLQYVRYHRKLFEI